MNAAIVLLVALTSASGPRAGSAIRGRIVGSDGNPAVGVRIVARKSITEAELAALRDAGKDRGEAGRTVTGPDGRLELRLPPGDYRVELSGKDFADGSFDSRLDPGEIDDVGEVEIPAARPFSGTVIDAGGRPSSGARVTIRSGGEESGLTLTTTALTGPDGKFTAAGAGERVDRIEAVAPGSPSHLVFRFGSTSSRPDSFIRLEPGRRVLGQVRRPNGAPAAGALVFASGHATRTKEDGSFSLDGVSKDPGPVVSTDGDLRGSVRLSRGKESVPVAIRLAETTRLSGSIVDAVTRRPVARARVQLRNVEKIAYSDGKGRFQLDGLVAGTEFLSADRKDYVASPFRSVELQGTGNRADIALIPGAVFEGRVLDPSRKPVAGVRIDAERGSPAVRSRKDGTFSILADARSVVTLTARARGFAPAVVAGLRAAPGGRRTGILISLAHGVSMSGRVVDGSGKPVGGARVQYREEIRRRYSSGSGLGHGDPDFVVTGTDGRFRLESLPSTTLALTVTHAPNATKIVSGVRVASSPPIPDIVLSPAAPVEGFVRDDKGNPVAAATVQAHAADADERAETGADGAFRFVTFAAGAQPTIFAYAAGYSMATRSCKAPAAGIVVVLSSDGIVRGTVEDGATGKPIPVFSAGWGTPRRGSGMVWTMAQEKFESEDGSFELRVQPGTGAVTVSAPGYQDSSVGGIVVAAGETRDGVVCSLHPDSRLAGRVIDDSSGAPVPAANVSWAFAGSLGLGDSMRWDFDNATSADSDGRFEFAGLPPGEKITLQATDFAHATASLDITTGGGSGVEIRMSPGGRIDGRLLDSAGRAVPGGNVEVTALGGDADLSDGATSDSSGNFEFDHLKTGTYRLAAQLGSSRSRPQEVTVAPDAPSATVVLTLAPGATIGGRVTGLSASELAALWVRASSNDGFNESAVPDASGTYEIDGVPVGSVKVTAAVRGLQGRSISRSAEIAEDASRVEVDLDFPAGSAISGTVTRGGRPQPQLWVSVQPATPGSPPTSGRATSDADGRYSIGGLQDGDYLVQTFDFGSYAGSSSRSRPVTIAGDTTLDIDLPTLSLSGVVVELGSSDPVPGVLVSLDDGASPSTMTQPQTTTDSGGRFRLDGLGSGATTLSATKREWQTLSQPLTLEDTSPELTIPLSRAEGISIHVSDGRTGLPLSSIQALFLSEAGAVAFDGPVALDSSGRGEIPQLSPGAYSAYFFSQGYAPQSPGSISIPTPPLTVSPTPGGELDIRSPESSEGTVATLTGASGIAYLWDAFHFDPRFSLGGTLTQKSRVAPGSYTLTVEWQSGPKSYPLQITEGRTTVVEIP